MDQRQPRLEHNTCTRSKEKNGILKNTRIWKIIVQS